MTGPEIMGVVVFFITVLGALSGIWWRVEGKISAAKERAEKVSDDLAAHKLHVAESYATKAGLSEQTSQIMKAIDSVSVKIDRTNERLDNLMSARGG